MKVLLAVDGSSCTKRMLAWLAANQLLSDAHTFTVVHAVAALPHRAAAVIDAEAARGFYEDDAETVLRPIRDYLAAKQVPVTYVHDVGAASEVVIRHAESPPHDMIVMGSHGHGEIAGMVLGSVTAKVLANCRVPVLVIR
jgi:nucleotide-binding universal stress UspA family protein